VGLADQGVELGDKSLVSFGFADQPRFSASAASAAASTRWAARIGSELGSAWKLGKCSQMLA
jgi:hypothetical protein